MDLSKNKTLTVGLCKLLYNELYAGEAGLTALPAYIIDIAGRKYGLLLRFADGDQERWTLCDMEYGKLIGPGFVFFHEVVSALEDDSWVTEEHERLSKAGLETVAQDDIVLFQVNNPPKGVPGLVLLPALYTDDDELDEEELVSDEEIEATIQGILSEQDDMYDEDDDEPEGDFSIGPDARMDWDKFIRVDTSEADTETEFEDDLLDDDMLYAYPGYDLADVAFEPVCAFVSKIGSHRVAFSLRMAAGPFALWSAFDITLGALLSTSMSLAEVMRSAPLMIPIMETNPQVSLSMMDYVDDLTELLSGSGQNVQRYLNDGYLKMNGAQYLSLMNRMFVDKGNEQSVQYWAERSPDVLFDYDFYDE